MGLPPARGRNPVKEHSSERRVRSRMLEGQRVVRRELLAVAIGLAAALCVTATKLRRHPHGFVNHRQIAVAYRVENRAAQR